MKTAAPNGFLGAPGPETRDLFPIAGLMGAKAFFNGLADAVRGLPPKNRRFSLSGGDAQ
jgi:hypothetical protein